MKRAIALVAATLLLSAACSDPVEPVNGSELPSMVTVEGFIRVMGDFSAREVTVTLVSEGLVFVLEGPLVTELAKLEGESVLVQGTERSEVFTSQKTLFYGVIEVHHYRVL